MSRRPEATVKNPTFEAMAPEQSVSQLVPSLLHILQVQVVLSHVAESAFALVDVEAEHVLQMTPVPSFKRIFEVSA